MLPAHPKTSNSPVEFFWCSTSRIWWDLIYYIKIRFFISVLAIWMLYMTFLADTLFPWCFSDYLCFHLITELLPSPLLVVYYTTSWFLVPYFFITGCLLLLLAIFFLWFLWLDIMSETTSSSSTMTSSMVETSVPKTMLGTIVKLHGSNYLLWAQAFCIFIGAQNKLAHLLQPPPADTVPRMWLGLLKIIL